MVMNISTSPVRQQTTVYYNTAELQSQTIKQTALSMNLKQHVTEYESFLKKHCTLPSQAINVEDSKKSRICWIPLMSNILDIL